MMFSFICWKLLVLLVQHLVSETYLVKILQILQKYCQNELLVVSLLFLSCVLFQKLRILEREGALRISDEGGPTMVGGDVPKKFET